MTLGRVIGSVWATVKNQSLHGQRLVIVQPLKPDLQPTAKPVICTDCTGAGTGELIYYCRGKNRAFRSCRPRWLPT